MKHISIAERYLPFSHRPGVRCVLPFSFYGIQVFPTLLRFFDMRETFPVILSEIAIEHPGPIKEFTVTLDLEKGRVTVGGYNSNYFRFHLFAEGEKVLLYREKGELTFNSPEDSSLSVDLVARASSETPHPVLGRDLSKLERLSLGSHRKQDEELIRRRGNMEDIIPLWHRLGLLLSTPLQSYLSGTASLLDGVGKGTADDYLQPFMSLWKSGMEGMFFPLLEDPLHQGISYLPLEAKKPISPLEILTQGAALIRSLFVQASGREIQLLPHLPTEFHCGRMINIELETASVELEWSKKLIRRMIFIPKESGEFRFDVPHVKTFRLRKSKKELGERFSVEKRINLEAGQKYSFDNFQK